MNTLAHAHIPGQRTALRAVPTPDQFIHPPCPPWCDRHWDSDEALRAGLPENQFRHHHGADVRVTLSTPPEEGRSKPVPPMELVLTLDRYDDHGRVGDVAVSTAFKDGDGPPLEMLPNPLDVASVRLLAQTLLDTLAPLDGAE